jgi:hypothetical protein
MSARSLSQSPLAAAWLQTALRGELKSEWFRRQGPHKIEGWVAARLGPLGTAPRNLLTGFLLAPNTDATTENPPMPDLESQMTELIAFGEKESNIDGHRME